MRKVADCIYDTDIEILMEHRRIYISHKDRAILVFPCGGREDVYPSRRHFKTYIHRSRSASLKNVFCLTAEDIIGRKELEKLNLVQQEAILADMCDWILIFAESQGSICELGIFTALPHALEITSAATDRQYRSGGSFLSDGPFAEIESAGGPLNEVFYLDPTNPMSDKLLMGFLSKLRNYVKLNSVNRRKFNKDQSNVMVGPLVHELLDLMQIFGPITQEDLISVYCRFKGFRKDEIEIKSAVLTLDMRAEVKIQFDQVLAMMEATGLIARKVGQHGESELLITKVHLDSYFMFNRTDSRRFTSMRSKVLLRKRRKGIWSGENVYSSSNSE